MKVEFGLLADQEVLLQLIEVTLVIYVFQIELENMNFMNCGLADLIILLHTIRFFNVI